MGHFFLSTNYTLPLLNVTYFLILAQMGVSEGKPVGSWFGPNTIAQVLK